MLDLRLHRRKIITLLVVATIVTPVAVFGINRIMSADVTKALTYAIPEGYETFKDATLYDCVARAYAEETGNSVPSTGLTDAQLAEVTKVVCSGKDISEDEWVSDATGIEKMINLDYLDLDSNRLTSIDLTNNTKLTYVDIGGAKINELDVSNNTMLRYLKVDNSLLTELDVSRNTHLVELRAFNSLLAGIDLTNNTELQYLDVDLNYITALDVTNNIHLLHLDVGNYQQAYDDRNQITELDLTNNTELQYLDVTSNRLTELDVTKNTELTRIDVRYNQLTELDVSKNLGLIELFVSDNQMTSLDVSNNVELQRLWVCSNQLATFDVTNNIKLTDLDVSNNQLTEFDVTNNTELWELGASFNQLNALDVTKNTKLKYLYINSNQLTEFDVMNNTELITLDIDSNEIAVLDVTQNAKLKELDVGANQLTTIDLTNNTELSDLDIHSNQFDVIDVTKNTKLKYFEAYSNQLTMLDVTSNTELVSLNASYNQLTELDVRNNNNLQKLSGDLDLPIRADISYLYVNGELVFDLANLKFLKSVAELDAYGYDETDKTLTISDLNATGGYARINTFLPSSFWGVIVMNRLILSDYVLTLDNNDGSDNTSTLVCLPESESGESCVVVLPTLSQTDQQSSAGKNFLGWADTPEATEPQYAANEEMTLTGRKTVYAVWQDVYTYTLNYDLNYEGDGDIESTSCTTTGESCNVTIINEKPSRESYVFLGWADTLDATTPNSDYTSGASITLTNNKTIYAVWAPEYTLSFNANGGNGSVLPQICHPTTTDGSCEVTIPAQTAINREGHRFLGWSTDSTATTSEKQGGDTMTLSADTTLYAVWEEILHYTLSYNLNGGTGSIDDAICTVASGEISCNVNIVTITSSTTPSREGYVFLGWADTLDATTPNSDYTSGASIALTNNKTIYAIWAPEYTLNFEVGESKTEIEALKCHPTTTNGTCNVTIPKTRPTLDGYEFFGWTKTEGDTMADYLPNEKYNFTKGNYSETLYAIWADGKVTWVQGQDMVETDDLDAILVIDYPSRSFVKLFIDGKEVNEKYYKVETEKTKITIDNEYLKELGPGTYTLEAAYEDDITVKTLFNIEEKEPEIKVPDTGNETHDVNNGAGVIMIAILPALGVAMITVMVWMVLRKYHTMRKW